MGRSRAEENRAASSSSREKEREEARKLRCAVLCFASVFANREYRDSETTPFVCDFSGWNKYKIIIVPGSVTVASSP